MDNLTASELAGELRISVATIRVWQSQGIPYEPVGRLRRYNLRAVKEWLREKEERRKLEQQRSRKQEVSSRVLRVQEKPQLFY